MRLPSCECRWVGLILEYKRTDIYRFRRSPKRRSPFNPGGTPRSAYGMSSSAANLSPPASFLDLPKDMRDLIFSLLDFRTRLTFSLCCRRARSILFDPNVWPRLVLGARATDEAISLVQAIYSTKRSALTELKLRDAQVTERFFSQLSSFLGSENSVRLLKVNRCRKIGCLDLSFPRATHIIVLGTITLLAKIRRLNAHT